MNTKPIFIAARYKYLLLVPFLVIVPIAAAFSLLNRTTEYQSSATVWVQRSKYIDDEISGCNPYVTLAQCQSGLLNEYMGTDSFALAVAARVGMPVTTDAEKALAVARVRSATSIYATGTHPIIVSHRAPDAQSAAIVVEGIVAEFQDEYKKTITEQTNFAKTIWEDRVSADREELDAVRAELYAFNPSTQVVSADPRFQQLQQELDRVQKRYDDSSATLNEIVRSQREIIENRDNSFEIVDPASVPAGPLPLNKKAFLMYPAAGFLLALSLSAAMYAFFMKTDRSVRASEDFEFIPNLTVLGTVPDLGFAKRRGWPKNFFRFALTTIGSSKESV
jgi:capsular polysaccharide biosynthesis protein